MKNLPLKLSIIILLVFGFILTGFALFPKLRLKWHESKLTRGNEKETLEAVKKLLPLGSEGEQIVLSWFAKQDTGWSRPGNGLVIRSEADIITFATGTKLKLVIKVLNVSNKAVDISHRTFNSLLPLIKGKAPDTASRLQFSPISVHPTIMSLPLKLEPGEVLDLPYGLGYNNLNPGERSFGVYLASSGTYYIITEGCDKEAVSFQLKIDDSSTLLTPPVIFKFPQ